MPQAGIKDYGRETSAAERATFQTSLFGAATGDAMEGSLRWGEPVEILERERDRTRIRTDDGREGWVREELVVEIGYLRRRAARGNSDYTSPARAAPTSWTGSSSGTTGITASA